MSQGFTTPPSNIPTLSLGTALLLSHVVNHTCLQHAPLLGVIADVSGPFDWYCLRNFTSVYEYFFSVEHFTLFICVDNIMQIA